jgi:hypothetical protein
MHLQVVAVWLAALLLTVVPSEPASVQSEPITPQGIERSIADLANDDFNTREQATDYLIRAGKHAEEAVKKALQSNDLEVRRRAQLALEQIKLAPPSIRLPRRSSSRRAARHAVKMTTVCCKIPSVSVKPRYRL